MTVTLKVDSLLDEMEGLISGAHSSINWCDRSVPGWEMQREIAEAARIQALATAVLALVAVGK